MNITRRSFLKGLVAASAVAIIPSIAIQPKDIDWMGGIFVNVKDFGAVGDGITNDFESISAAVDYVNARGGGTIFMPAGTYQV